jgi:hypothetical protein
LLSCGLLVSHLLAVVLDNASGCRTHNGVMARNVPGHSADNGTF